MIIAAYMFDYSPRVVDFKRALRLAGSILDAAFGGFVFGRRAWRLFFWLDVLSRLCFFLVRSAAQMH